MLHPALHSSKVTAVKFQQLDEAVQALQDPDDRSLHTIETTSSDIRYAVKGLENMNFPAGHRYEGLPPGHYLDEEDLGRVVKDLKNLKTRPREVKKKEKEPVFSTEDWALLQEPELDVQVAVNFDASIG